MLTDSKTRLWVRLLKTKTCSQIQGLSPESDNTELISAMKDVVVARFGLHSEFSQSATSWQMTETLPSFFKMHALVRL